VVKPKGAGQAVTKNSAGEAEGGVKIPGL
jgi:hypothetical protein